MMKLTKREYFAAQAMQALISKAPVVIMPYDLDHPIYEEISRGAVEYADALILELETDD